MPKEYSGSNWALQKIQETLGRLSELGFQEEKLREEVVEVLLAHDKYHLDSWCTGGTVAQQMKLGDLFEMNLCEDCRGPFTRLKTITTGQEYLKMLDKKSFISSKHPLNLRTMLREDQLSFQTLEILKKRHSLSSNSSALHDLHEKVLEQQQEKYLKTKNALRTQEMREKIIKLCEEDLSKRQANALDASSKGEFPVDELLEKTLLKTVVIGINYNPRKYNGLREDLLDTIFLSFWEKRSGAGHFVLVVPETICKWLEVEISANKKILAKYGQEEEGLYVEFLNNKIVRETLQESDKDEAFIETLSKIWLPEQKGEFKKFSAAVKATRILLEN